MGVPPLGPLIKPGQKFGENPTADLPADHPLIRQFGDYQPLGHSGIDYPAPLGTPVYATEDGLVTWVGFGEDLPGDDSHAGYVSRYYLQKWASGHTVAIEHAARGGYVTLTYHLQGYAPGLKAGDRVKRGQLIGYCGTTGRSTGPHAHLDVIPTTYPWTNGHYGRVDPLPYLQDPWPTNPTKEPVMPSLWVPGAVRRPQGLAVALDTSLPPRAVWHITSDVDPGRLQPPFTNIATYLINQGYCPHLMWDPFTGYMEQYYPANVGARALAAWNQDGRHCFQIEVMFSAGAIRNGRRYDVLAQTPLKGYGTILEFIDQLGIPRRWPMGPPPPLHTNSKRDVGIWNTQAGHYGHVHVPNNDHTDPGLFPPLTTADTKVEPQVSKPVVKDSGKVHVVAKGESVSGIAQKYGTTVAAIQALNTYITNPNYLNVGDRIKIPEVPGSGGASKPAPKPIPKTKVHVVAKGQSLSWIAEKYGTDIATLQKLNTYIKNPDYLNIGDKVVVPATPSAPKPLIHVVKPGESLSGIAAAYGTTVANLQQLNTYIKNPNYLNVGDRVRIK